MDRQMVYAGQVPLETDILNTNQYAMLSLAKLAGAVFGTGNTMVNGFACTATTPASMQVNIAGGEVYSLQSVDTSAYSSLPADTGHQIVKQGILWDTTTATIKAPTTVGQSINYLVQVAFIETDSGAKVLQYYNSANPAQSFSGAGNSGAVQPTVRQNTCAINIKSGTAATTGSQVTPTPDAGYAGLWVITVGTGQTTITSSNITAYSNAPFINSGLLGLTPNFSVSPTAPTPPSGDTSNKIATTAFVQTAMGGGVTGSLAQNGWTKLPNGLIMQWGTRVVGGSGARTDSFNFPIAFPNACFQASASDSGPSCATLSANASSPTSINVYIPAVTFGTSSTAQTTSTAGYFWQAIGY